MKTLLIVLISLAAIGLAVEFYATNIIIKIVGSDIREDAEAALFSIKRLLKVIGHCYKVVNIQVAKDFYDSAIKPVQYNIRWNWLLLKRDVMKIVDTVLTAWFLLYDYFTIENKPELDLDENFAVVTKKPLNSKDVANIYTKYAESILEDNTKDMSSEEQIQYWKNLTRRLAINPDAVRSIETELSIIEQRKGDYYMSKRFEIHKRNYDEPAPELEKVCFDTVNKEESDGPVTDGNVIYLNRQTKTAIEDAQRISEILCSDEERMINMDENLYQQSLEFFTGLPFNQVSGFQALKFNSIIADLCEEQYFEDTDPDEVQLVYRAILMGTITNPLKAKHDICETKDIIYVRPGEAVSYEEEQSRNDSSKSVSAQTKSEERPWLHRKVLDQNPVIFKPRTKTIGLTDEQIDKEFYKYMAKEYPDMYTENGPIKSDADLAQAEAASTKMD